MTKYRKKPIIVEAVKWTGKNWQEINDFCPTARYPTPERVRIETLEGQMRAEIGDWVIKGVKGEFYLCKPDIFEATYEPIENEQAAGE